MRAEKKLKIMRRPARRLASDFFAAACRSCRRRHSTSLSCGEAAAYPPACMALPYGASVPSFIVAANRRPLMADEGTVVGEGGPRPRHRPHLRFSARRRRVAGPLFHRLLPAPVRRCGLVSAESRCRLRRPAALKKRLVGACVHVASRTIEAWLRAHRRRAPASKLLRADILELVFLQSAHPFVERRRLHHSIFRLADFHLSG